MLNTLLRARKRVLLVGPPGIAKTARVHAAAKQEGFSLVTMRASLAERVDVGGCLVPDTEKGVTRALPLDTLYKLRITEEDTILFLDDLGQAPVDTQSSLMSLFDSGNLSPKVIIWGATNRPGDKAGVTSLCEPLRSRFHLAFGIPTPDSEEKPDGAVMLGTWKEECENWCQWAMDQNGAPEVVAWHRSTTGRTLYNWKPHADPAVRMPDYRSWETVLDLWDAGIKDDRSIAAAIGRAATAEFMAYAAIADKVPTPEQVRKKPDKATVPEDPSALYLVATMLACTAEEKDCDPFCVYLQRLPRIFQALLGRDLYRRLKAGFSRNPIAVKWYTENQALFVT